MYVTNCHFVLRIEVGAACQIFCLYIQSLDVDIVNDHKKTIQPKHNNNDSIFKQQTPVHLLTVDFHR